MSKALQEAYFNNCRMPSDMHEHLPTLKMYADQCKNVLELGHRRGCSTSALMVSRATIVHSVDIQYCKSWEFYQYESQNDPDAPDFAYFQAHTIGWEIPQRYDLILIDDLHNGDHLFEELVKYGPFCSRWMMLHDTETFGRAGESNRFGLRDGILDFLMLPEGGPYWKIQEHRKNNNGLTVLERVIEQS